MYLAERLLQLREAKNLSQGDIEQRTGLLRCYVSRVENGHTVPSLETLEKLARALEVPLYQLFYEGKDAPEAPRIPPKNGEGDWASSGKGLRLFTKIQRAVAKMNEQDRGLILRLAEEVSKKSSG
jgi:transcriptional regulator with XRE-family HTH domain